MSPSEKLSEQRLVYIAHTSDQLELARSITAGLAATGFHVFLAAETIAAGENWDRRIGEALERALAFVVIVGRNDLSEYLQMEIGQAVQKARGSQEAIVIPVVAGNASFQDLPFQLRVFQGLDARRHSVAELVKDISSAIGRHAGRQTVLVQRRQEEVAAIKSSAADHIKSSMEALKARENNYSSLAWFWYTLGFVALLTGAGVGVWRLVTLQPQVGEVGTGTIVTLGMAAALAVVAIVMLIALSKYCFNLGKAYMVEALRNSDRMHAISFGEFYLKAYGASVDKEEIKNVLQHWNIDKGSAFMSQSSDGFDPKLTEATINLLKAVKDLQTTGQSDKK